MLLMTFLSILDPLCQSKIPNCSTHFTEYLHTRNLNSMFLKHCELDEVISIINKLSNSKACGPNSIPTNLLTLSTNVLGPIIALLINQSFEEGEFPDILKIAQVCPIFKKDRVDECKNYRLISLLSNLSLQNYSRNIVGFRNASTTCTHVTHCALSS